MSRDVKRRQKDIIKNLQFFSIAIDAGTDAADTAQVSVFVRGVKEAFDVVEEIVELVPTKGTTTGANILSALLLCIGDMDLDLSNMISISTDGAPAVTGKNRGGSYEAIFPPALLTLVLLKTNSGCLVLRLMST
ncbi:general transcription factor II-I repeat domain-containing protein 2A-like [Styela clava]